ncbi:dihydrodipicolinate synthase family protein [Paenibacillus sp. MBLB4367]|uniref:dihydrodipicolinate synthase family protein n=1 Tax=Paenibacillus sp. MBLB4367 TaxID=3384767 RepID=UPI003907EBB9
MSNRASAGPADRFKGIYALLLTPFQLNKEIDWEAYDRYVEWQLSHSPHGLFAVCGSSEMEYLTLQERLTLAERAVRLAGSTPVIATGNVQSDPAEHAEELQRMAETGVSGIVLIPQGSMGEDQNRLEDYFARLADLSPLPVFLYECPLASPRFVDPDVYGRLVSQHGIVGIKDTTCTAEGIRSKIESATESLVFQANMSFLLEALHSGAQGIMATTSAAAADVALALWSEAANGKREAAETLHELLVFLDGVLGKGYPATAKHLAKLRGIPMNELTRKGKSMNDSARQGIAVWKRAADRTLAAL